MSYPDYCDLLIDEVIAALRANRDKVIEILQRDRGDPSSIHRELTVILGDVRRRIKG
jgi:hypothetical protein